MAGGSVVAIGGKYMMVGETRWNRAKKKETEALNKREKRDFWKKNIKISIITKLSSKQMN